MNKKLYLIAAAMLLSACTSLTFQEKQEISRLKYQGINIDRGPNGWEKPNSPLMAGALNILPGIGNMYLASGNAGDSSQWIYAAGNLLLWPISILWGIPEAAIDANTINQRDMLDYLKYGNQPNFSVQQGMRRSNAIRQAPNRYYR